VTVDYAKLWYFVGLTIIKKVKKLYFVTKNVKTSKDSMFFTKINKFITLEIWCNSLSKTSIIFKTFKTDYKNSFCT